jgi:hypothetical protein
MKGNDEQVAGIRAAKVAGGGSAKGAGAASGALNAGGKAKTESIASGGSKSTVVNITMRNLVERLEVNAGNVQESAGKIRDIIVDELTRALEMGAALGS